MRPVGKGGRAFFKVSDAGKMSLLDPVQKSGTLMSELIKTENTEESFFQAVSSAKIIIVEQHDITGFFLLLIQQGVPLCQ